MDYSMEEIGKFSTASLITRTTNDIQQIQIFVQGMGNGYHAAVAQGGTNLSGGQKQRLAIARAIYRRPEIYIFDDSFSALDYKTDRILRKTLKQETEKWVAEKRQKISAVP